MARVDDHQDDEADSELARHVRAGVYQRVSKLATAQDHREIERVRSIEEQNKANQDECDQHGWTVTERYEDPGLSASRFATKARPEYRRLLADIRAGKLDVVVLWESSRGDRELAGWAQFLNACRENRTRIYITTHGRLYDMDNGRDWRSLAEDGVEKLRRRTTSTRSPRSPLFLPRPRRGPGRREGFGPCRRSAAETHLMCDGSASLDVRRGLWSIGRMATDRDRACRP
jgi:hypothetical protein